MEKVIRLMLFWAAASLIGAAVCASHDATPDLFAYGFPSSDYMLRGDFAICFDGMTRNPRWTLEHINADKLKGRASRDGMDFRTDDEIPSEFAPAPSDYARSGFDLGHAACAANHDGSKELLKATFTIANAMPQDPKLNRGKWRELESAIRATAEKRGVNVWVVTAPIWYVGPGWAVLDKPSTDGGKRIQSFKKITTISENDIWVPTHFLKAVLIDDNGAVRLKAWIMGNSECREPLDVYEVTTDAAERIVGLDLWNKLEVDEQKRLEAMK